MCGPLSARDLPRAVTALLLLYLHPPQSHCRREVGQAGSFYTIELGKCYKPGHFSSQELVFKHYTTIQG